MNTYRDYAAEAREEQRLLEDVESAVEDATNKLMSVDFTREQALAIAEFILEDRLEGYYLYARKRKKAIEEQPPS